MPVPFILTSTILAFTIQTNYLLVTLIISGQPPPDLTSFQTVDIIDHQHLDTPPFTVQLTIPPHSQFIGCKISTDTYHNLP
jgi:hypothetical protein